MKWSLLSIILLSYLCIACSQEASHQPTSNQKTSNQEMTYVLAQHETPIFNAQKQLIGIENKKTQQKYALGEEVMLDGLHTATTTQNPKHPLPPQCFQNVYIGGNILKQ